MTQRRALNVRTMGENVINADVDGEDFDDRWGRLPVRQQLLLYVAVPIIAVWLYLFGSRKWLARCAQREDLPTREEVLRGDILSEFDSLVIDDRDAHLLMVIESTYQESQSRDVRVAIVYGARHMRAVTSLLMHKLRYRVAGAEWITVF